ncbi:MULTISPECIES: QueT transporter family protein [unclassified Haladaptatus]|uniref:QueT transporter family protein n=1 Tax=unclassified Haladaptatus TaxID=2622732 RepID=UPI00209C2F11|nr:MULTISPECIES: QueT transporter family protein [unclassified Haladaptatus]MCO8245840.1 QueT transporter family protein [Haladaptatus sp. AB643]MCO8256187.1 QueT transporter family protein [Haladaptatus sp. AB618]
MSVASVAPQLDQHERRRLIWLHGLLVLLGLWITFSPLTLRSEFRVEDHALLGLAIVLFAGLYIVGLLRSRSLSFVSEWMIALLGLIVFGISTVSSLVSDNVLWSDVIAGGLVTLIAVYVIYTLGRVRKREREAVDADA